MNRKTWACALLVLSTTLLVSACSITSAIKPAPTYTPVPAPVTATPTAVPTIDGIVLDSDYITNILNKTAKLSAYSLKADYSDGVTDKKVSYWYLEGKKKIVVTEGETYTATVENETGIFSYSTDSLAGKRVDEFINPAYEKLNPEMAKNTTFFYHSQGRIFDKACLEISWIDENGYRMYASVSEADGVVMRVRSDSSEYIYNYCVTDFSADKPEAAAVVLPEEVVIK